MAKPALVSDVIRLMEAWAPAWTAEPWDRVGLLAGNPQAEAQSVRISLDLTPELLDDALHAGVQMILTHHPPMFRPLENLRTDNPAGARLIKAAAAGLALFAAHTNLDAAPDGVNDALALALGLVEVKVLEQKQDGLAKLVTFVPAEYMEQVAQALFQAGAGCIGEYRECSFTISGNGAFLAPPAGRPFIGKPGQREKVSEERLEMVVPTARAAGALQALTEVHPYEEPAVDLYPLNQGPAGVGLGRVGMLPTPMPLKDFATQAARTLGAGSPQICGHLLPEVERVAVIGGSGGDMLAAAAAAGAQLLVTGEARYHQAEEALDLGLGLLTLGHYQTEAVVINPWALRLQEMLEQEGLTCQVEAWTLGSDLWRPILFS